MQWTQRIFFNAPTCMVLCGTGISKILISRPPGVPLSSIFLSDASFATPHIKMEFLCQWLEHFSQHTSNEPQNEWVLFPLPLALFKQTVGVENCSELYLRNSSSPPSLAAGRCGGTWGTQPVQVSLSRWAPCCPAPLRTVLGCWREHSLLLLLVSLLRLWLQTGLPSHEKESGVVLWQWSNF